MLDEARQLEAAELPRVGRKVRWVQGSAEDLAGLIEETVAAVIMGQSFHWMDRERVLEQCNKVIKPSGGVSLISGAGSIWTRPEPAWCVVVKEVIQEFLGTERRVGSGIYQEPKDRHEEMLGRSAFTNVARWSTAVSIERTLEQLIGLQYSTSYCAPRFFGDRKSEFEKTLERRLLALHPNGIFVDQYEVKCLCATRYTGSAQ
jgi:SAM-dependent methyltransferase